MLTQKTLLEAVNNMLLLIGEAPVQSLTNTDFQPAAIAKALLENETKLIQSRGWNFNTTLKEVLELSPEGYLYVPSNTLSCVPFYKDQGIVLKGDRMYNLNTNSYVFTANLEVNITYLYSFPDCPIQFQNYVEIVAGRKFENRMLKTGSMYQLTDKEERDAKVAFLEYDTALKSPNVADNAMVGAVGNRLVNPLPYGRK